jgi:LysR family nitrogen assimilation transcriptional regulator
LLVTEGVSAVLHELVLTGKLDTAVVSDAEPLGMLRSRLLLREQLYLVGPNDAHLRMEVEVPVSSLAERPLILTSRPNAMRLIVDNALAERGHRITRVFAEDSNACLVLSCGLGVAHPREPITGAGNGHFFAVRKVGSFALTNPEGRN